MAYYWGMPQCSKKRVPLKRLGHQVMNWSRVLFLFIFFFSWGKMKYVVHVEKGAEFYTTLLAAVQPHTHAWWNTRFQVNRFLEQSIPLENWNNWMCAEDASRQQRSGRGMTQCTARVRKGYVFELESKVWLWELALQSCGWSLSFQNETWELCFARSLSSVCQNGKIITFHHLKYRYLLTFGYQRISYSYFSFLICLQYFSSFLTLII